MREPEPPAPAYTLAALPRGAKRRALPEPGAPPERWVLEYTVLRE